MTDTQAITDTLADQLEALLTKCEDELGRPLEPDEIDSITDEFLAPLDDDSDGWESL